MSSNTAGWRLPAKELEDVILQIICDFLRDQLRLLGVLQQHNIAPGQLRGIIAEATNVTNELKAGPIERQRQLLSTLIHRTILASDSIRIEIKRSDLAGLLMTKNSESYEYTEQLFSLVVPVQMKRRGVEAKLVIRAAGKASTPPDPKLVALITDAYRWVDDLAQGRASSIRDIAQQNDRDPGEVSRTLPLAFLATDIVEAILEGRQPLELTPHDLKRIGTLPAQWDDQRRRFGFSP